ncbi:MAG: hypothetical protein O3A10_06510 [Chloroflexi bacterium]|nr:hypothetical protein [Chloroflexota bacterium]MDA1145025.1 hypothetical protein [Chloroflexota bacterium]MQC82910.1 hypothetical protein [Chloroflexota bacterium]
MRADFELRHSTPTRVAAVVAPAVEFLLFGILVTYGDTTTESAAAIASLLMAVSFIHSWCVLGSRYELSDESLWIVHGPWRRRFGLGDVLAARPIRTLDRGPVVQVRLAYGRQLLLTPDDRGAFLDALQAHVPHLQVDAAEAATRAAG